MRRAISIIVLISIVFFTLTSCGTKTDEKETDSNKNSTELSDDKKEEKTEKSDKKVGGKSVDLTVLSTTMIYSEVYNMMVNPEEYVGGTIKVKGKFVVYEDKEKKTNYYAVIVEDATACCQQGLEFVLAGDYRYPEDYPAKDTEITVTGTFQTYKADGTTLSHLVDAKMTID